MSDHIPDVTKMIQDTPRTDAVIARDTGDSGLIAELAREARTIERELNAANERIKRLEEAGDEMEKYCRDYYSSNRWNKAKEAKL
jgi:hypothetical protein